MLRTLETAANEGGLVAAETGHSSLFIAPGFKSRVADALITNFHAPRTTLVVLVAAWPDPDMDLKGRYVFVDWGPEFVQAHALRPGERALVAGFLGHVEGVGGA